MDGSQGVYISISSQSPKTKILIATSRDTWAECKQDLRDIFGDEFADGVANIAVTESEITKPVLTVVSGEPNVPEKLSVSEVAKELGATVGETETFETCSCGYLKDRWVSPGVAKNTGKPYAGFFACSNPVRHR